MASPRAAVSGLAGLMTGLWLALRLPARSHRCALAACVDLEDAKAPLL